MNNTLQAKTPDLGETVGRELDIELDRLEARVGASRRSVNMTIIRVSNMSCVTPAGLTDANVNAGMLKIKLHD